MGKAAVSQEEIQLRKRARRRLVGAAFMVLVMVIVLPMLLDSEPRPQAESVRVQMPTPEAEHVDPPKVDPPKAAPSPKSESNLPKEAPETLAESEPVSEPTGTTPTSALPPPASTSAIAVTDRPTLTTVPAAESVTEALTAPVVIQLGAFTKPENAQQLTSALNAKKIKVFTEPITMGAMTKTRVRAGPFSSMDEAEKARERINQMNLRLGMAPKIVPQGQ